MHRSPRSAPRLLLLLISLVPALAWSQVLRFTTLDIGQGDSAVLIAPGGCVALFDGGPTGSGTVIKAYLKSLGVTHIDMAFVSHMHTDHIGGIDEVDTGTNAVPIDAVYDHGGTYDSTVYTSYVNHFSGRRYKVIRGQTFSLCNQVTLKVVAAGGNGISSTDENTKSVAVKITYGAFNALVGGDLTAVPDVESTTLLDVGELDLYKVHHHGSRTSSGDPFLNATNPQVSFISVGRDNTYGHPTQECLGRLTAHGSSIWQTEDPATNKARGHIQLTTVDGNTFQVTQGTQSATYTSKAASVGPDVTSPSQPGLLTASAVSPTEIDLTWAPSTDNVGVTAYRIYRATNGVSFNLAGSSPVTGFADMGLGSGVSYSYLVTAVDAQDNESTPASASVRTPSPRITVTSPNGGERWSQGSVHNVTWTSMGVTQVKLEYTLDNGATWKLIATNVASPGSAAWTLPGTLSSSARVRVTSLTSSLWDSSDAPFSVVTPAAPARVILNEILANEPGTSPDGEFVELVNVGGTAADLGGWVISDADQVRHTFATGTTLAPGKAIVVYGGVKGIPPGTPNVVVASTGTLSLNNGGDTVTVKTSAGGSTVDAFTYGSALASQDGVSMNRSPDLNPSGDFVLHNTLSSLSASPGVRVNGTAF